MIGQMTIAIALPDLTMLEAQWTLVFFSWIIFTTDFLRKAKKWRKSVQKFEFFAKCTIEFHSFQLFVYLCDGFKCLLKG